MSGRVGVSLRMKTVQELVDGGLPLRQPYLGSSFKICESHELLTPIIFLEPNHKLMLEFVALHDELL